MVEERRIYPLGTTNICSICSHLCSINLVMVSWLDSSARCTLRVLEEPVAVVINLALSRLGVSHT